MSVVENLRIPVKPGRTCPCGRSKTVNGNNKLWSLLLDFWWGASQGEQIESIGHASTPQERLQELTRLTGQTQRDCMYLRASFFLLFSNCMTWGSPGATFQDYPYL